MGARPAGCGLVAVHATFRSPNLKARLGSAREEFRSVDAVGMPAAVDPDMLT